MQKYRQELACALILIELKAWFVCGEKKRSWLGPSSFVSDPSPTPRAFFGFAVANQKLFLFGGYADSGGLITVLLYSFGENTTTNAGTNALSIRTLGDHNDLNVYNPATNQWSKLQVSTTSATPTKRDSFGFTYAVGNLYLFGGENADFTTGMQKVQSTVKV